MTTHRIAAALLAAAWAAGAAGQDRGKPWDETRVAWQDDRARFRQGLVGAERFRRELLDKPGRARLVGRAIEAFRQKYAAPLPGRPSVRNFGITADGFIGQLRGERSFKPKQAFGGFAGRWYGTWDRKSVDHHWHTTVTEPAKLRHGEPKAPPLVGYQYAWIGDGFGWNYAVRPPGVKGTVVLGFVNHLKAHVPKAVTARTPLVGYYDGPNRLVWVTADHVFLEEAFPPQKRYVITGFRYDIRGGRLAARDEGFQSIYTRSPDSRPEFKKFKVALAVTSGGEPMCFGSRCLRPGPLDGADHAPFARLLKKHVGAEGKVDYAAWKADAGDTAALDAYLVSLGRVDPSRPADRAARLAFWLNAYNAVTVRGILARYPITTIRPGRGEAGFHFWKDLRLWVGTERHSLDDIEHNILRKMGEPRIHFALVCGANGCPALNNDAFTGEKLDTQLRQSARRFFADPRHFRIDPKTGTVHMSKLLDWYAEDFGATEAERFRAYRRFLPKGEESAALADPKAKRKFMKYDWGLNARPAKRER